LGSAWRIRPKSGCDTDFITIPGRQVAITYGVAHRDVVCRQADCCPVAESGNAELSGLRGF
jgi:hypothetical protein